MTPLLPYAPESLKFRLIWLTAVGTTFTSEWRESMIDSPNLQMEFTVSLVRTEEEHAFGIFQEGRGKFKFPDWRLAKKGRVSSGALPWRQTNHYLTVGDEVYQTDGNEYIVCTVTAITATTVTLSEYLPGRFITVAPLLLMKLTADPAFKSSTGVLSSLSVSCVCETYPGFVGAALNSWGDHAALLTRPPLSASNRDARLEVAYDTGAHGMIGLTLDRERPAARGTYGFEVDSVAEYVTREREITFYAGRSGQFYAPTWTDDFHLKAPANTGDTFLYLVPQRTQTVDPLSAIAVVGPLTVQRFLSARVVSSAADETILELDTPLSSPIEVTPQTTLSRANLMRLDTDSVECEMLPAGAFRCNAAIVEVML